MILTLGTACTRQRGPEPRTWSPIGSTHVAPSDRVRPEIQEPAFAQLEARELAETVSALSVGPRLDHSNISRSFEKLADALAILAPQQAASLDTIRRMAEALRLTRESSMMHANATRMGLEAAAQILATVSPRRPSPQPLRYPDVVRALDRTVEELDPDAPLMEQHRLVVSAFEGASRAVHLAFGVEPPAQPAQIED